MSAMSQSHHSLQGIVPALVTPFDQLERIDYGAYQVIIDTLVSEGVDGLFAAGGQGEFFSLEEAERVEVLRACQRIADGRVAVFGNVGCITTRASVRLAQRAEADGLDFLVVITPFYLKPSVEELASHFIEICRAVRKPVLAYNIPDRTGVEVTPSVIARVTAACHNFVGLKDSSGDISRLPLLMESGQGQKMSIFMGRDNIILPGLKMGCVGAVTACANVAPRLFVALYRAFRAGDDATAERLQELINPLRMAFNSHTFPAVVKEAMQMVGLPAGPCRKPVGPMPAEARTKLANIVDELKAQGFVPQYDKVIQPRGQAEGAS